jgi:hypothetical protein
MLRSVQYGRRSATAGPKYVSFGPRFKNVLRVGSTIGFGKAIGPVMRHGLAKRSARHDQEFCAV